MSDAEPVRGGAAVSGGVDASDAAGVLMLCEMLGEDTVTGAVAALVALREHLAEVAAALGCADGGDVLKAARVCAVEAGLWRDMSGGGSAELRVDADCGQVRGLVRL